MWTRSQTITVAERILVDSVFAVIYTGIEPAENESVQRL